jgi:hypothetical protein
MTCMRDNFTMVIALSKNLATMTACLEVGKPVLRSGVGYVACQRGYRNKRL